MKQSPKYSQKTKSEYRVRVPKQFNIASHLLDRHIGEGRGPNKALICPDREWSYGELAELTGRFVNGLRSLGVEPGQRVLLVLPDCAEMVIGYLGTMKAGAIAVPTNTALRAEDYAYFLDESQAALLVTHADLWPRIEAALPDRPWLRNVVVCGDAPDSALSWESWLRPQATGSETALTRADDEAFWLWTSGSTGTPKAAVHRHRDWMYCCHHYAGGILGIKESDRCFSSSKLFHAYGLGNGLAFPFHVGAQAVLEPGRPTPASILERAAQTRPTLFFCVPTLYGAMLHHLQENNDYDLSSIRLAVSAAEPLPGSIYEAWRKRFGCEILDGIGSTEVLHIYASPRPGQSRPDTTGFVVSGYQIRITDEAGLQIEQGQVGDLWVKGNSTAAHYWNRPELTAERMQGDWFFTGDKYWRDPEGYLHYAGRSDDMFRVSGQWVSPIEVESALIEHAGVLECAVVPWQDGAGLVKPRAYIVSSDGETGSDRIDELQHWVKTRIAPYKYPRVIEFVSDLPKTAAGKIQRFKLRESAEVRG